MRVVEYLQNGRLHVQEITSSRNFIVPSGVYVIFISGVGAGGGGAAGASNTSTLAAVGGWGGSSGASAIMLPMFVTPGQVIPIVIGVGGLGGVGITINSNGSILNVGSPGTDTTIGDIVLPGGGRGEGTLVDNAGKPPLDLDDSVVSRGHFYHGARSGYPAILSAGAIGAPGVENKQGGKAGGGSPFSLGADGGAGCADNASPGSDGAAGSRGSGGGGGGAAHAGNQTGSGGQGGNGYVTIGWQ
ncbi:MAG: hypothetical protein ABW152_18120 [Candidatus Thiodiazotropha endolucinida]